MATVTLHPDEQARDSSNEPLEVKIIAAASDGFVNVTPEKCERIRALLAKARLAEAEWWDKRVSEHVKTYFLEEYTDHLASLVTRREEESDDYNR